MSDSTFMTQLVNLIKLHEGYRAKVYDDTVGKLTIGYGRNLDSKGLSQDEWNMIRT